MDADDHGTIKHLYSYSHIGIITVKKLHKVGKTPTGSEVIITGGFEPPTGSSSVYDRVPKLIQGFWFVFRSSQIDRWRDRRRREGGKTSSINGSMSTSSRDAGKIAQDYGKTTVKGKYKQRKVGRKIYTRRKNNMNIR